MSTLSFSLRTFLHVDPAELTDQAIVDIQELCLLNEEIQKLNPVVQSTSMSGRLQIEFTFSAEDFADAELKASDSIAYLLEFLNSKNLHEEIREGSNRLTFA